MTARFVAYYCVSTDKQGRSGLGLGLGLKAQRAAVEAHVTGAPGAVAAEFMEIESGRKKDRPQLTAALAAARAHRAVLVIANLDRLGPSVHFVMRFDGERCRVRRRRHTDGQPPHLYWQEKLI